MMLKCPAVIPKPYRFTGLKKNVIRKSTGMNNTVPVKNAKRIVGYNLGFDMTMLEQNGIKLPTEKKYVDLMIPFAKAYGMKKLDGEYKWQKLITCAKFYGFKETEWHNSLADTNATMFCYKEMVKRAHITDREILQPRGVQNYKGRGRRGMA